MTKAEIEAKIRKLARKAARGHDGKGLEDAIAKAMEELVECLVVGLEKRVDSLERAQALMKPHTQLVPAVAQPAPIVHVSCSHSSPSRPGPIVHGRGHI